MAPKKKVNAMGTAALGGATESVGRLGRWLGSHLGVTRAVADLGRRGTTRPGSSPGIESVAGVDQPPPADTVRVSWIDYGPDCIETVEEGALEALCERPRPEGGRVRWINIDGLHPFVVDRVRRRFGIHTLAAEDVLRPHQRPKLELFDDHLYVVARMLTLQEGELRQEQVSFFLFADTLITFQERRGDVWDPIRQRLQKANSRIRSMDASYLLYALLDAVVDHCFPILESYGEVLEELELAVLDNPRADTQQKIHRVKRELALLRRVLWPMREVVSQLQRDETEEISAPVKAYMRDVYDHAVQLMDILESYREQAGGLNDLYMAAVANRMNEIMKVLTLIGSVFIPLTFVAGVYGMNFEHIPELAWEYSYPLFWLACAVIVVGLVIFFRRKGWIGGS